MSKRIQRKRVKDFRLTDASDNPNGVVCVTRPSRHSNPYKIGTIYKNPFTGGTLTITRENCLELFEIYVKGQLAADPNWLEPLRDKDLACFCKLTDPCHGDVLLRLIAEMYP